MNGHRCVQQTLTMPLALSSQRADRAGTPVISTGVSSVMTRGLSKSFNIIFDESVKLCFRVTVGLIIVGGCQPAIRVHLPIIFALCGPPRIFRVGSAFIGVEKRSNLKACIGDAYTKYLKEHKTSVQRYIVVAFEIRYHIIAAAVILLLSCYVFAVAFFSEH